MSVEEDEISRDELLRRYQQKAAAPKAGTERRSPFKFLDSYGVDDADIFFGRDYEIEELLQRYNGHGCVLIYGESGAGKSSLVQCGLRSRIPSEDALFLAPRVHGSGLPTMCEQIYEMTGKALGMEAEVPADADLHSTLREVCDAASRPVVLFFDQFEELFIFHEAAERQAFAEALAALPRLRLNVKVIIGIRQDYLAYLSELEDTVEGLFDNRFWLRRMARETAAQAVVQACAKGDVTIGEEVATAILQRLDPSGEGVELPYLQVVMDRLFRQAVQLNKEDSSITIEDVEKLGDVANILGAFLVEEVGKLPEPDTGRQLLKAFVTQEGTRKAITRTSVAQEVAGFGGEIAPDVLDDLLQRLARVRILREVADTDTFELRHDALAATVASWITEVEKELIEVRDNILNRFREWEARNQPDSALLDSEFLDYLEVFRQRLDPLMDDEMREYIEESSAFIQRQKAAKRRLVVGSLLAVAILVIAFGVVYLANVTQARNRAEAAFADADVARKKAEQEHEIAQAEKKKADEAAAAAKASAEVAKKAEAAATAALGTAKEEKARADKEAELARKNEREARAAQALAKAAEGRATSALEAARKSEAAAKDSAAAALKAKGEAEVAKTEVEREKERAEAGERQQIRNLFESFLTQGILQAENGDYAAAAQAMTNANKAAAGLAGHDVIPATRHAMRNTVAWLTDVSRIVSTRVHTGARTPLKSIAVSPDAGKVVAGGENGSVTFFAADTTPMRHQVNAHKELVSGVVFLPDGKRVITASHDKMIRLYALSPNDPETHKLVREWRAPESVGALGISPDGRLLATGNEAGEINIWNPETGEQLTTLTGHTKAIGTIVFSADGSRFASASFDRTARVWDVSNGRFTLAFVTPKAFESLLSVALSDDGQLAATAGLDGVIRIWNVDRGDPLQRLAEHRSAVTALEFQDDGRNLISGSLDRTIRIWDVDSGVRIRVLQGHQTGVTAMARRGNLLFSCGNDQTVRQWPLYASANAGNVRLVKLPLGIPQAVAISPSHDSVAVGFDEGQIAVYSLPDLDLRWQDKVGELIISRLAFSPDGARLAAADFSGEIRIFKTGKADTSRLVRTLNHHVQVVNGLAFSPGGRFLATASIGGQVVFSDDQIVSSDQASGGQIGLINVATGEALSYPAHRNEVLSVTFNPTGDRLISSGDDGRSILWRHTNGRLAREAELPEGTDTIYASSFSPNGAHVAEAGRSGVLDIVDLQTRKVVFDLAGHENTILRLSYTPDGGQIITASTDGSLRFWDVADHRAVFSLRLPIGRDNDGPLWDFDFAYLPSQGGWMAVPLTNGKLLLYRIQPIFDIDAASAPK